VNAPRRDWRLVTAGVVVMLLALVVVGRLQGRNLAGSDAGASRATTGTVGTDDSPVASGLAVAGRVALPGPAVAVEVGEGAVWVLLEQGTLLRVHPDRHQVTGRLELGASTGGMGVGPLAVGAGAVWVGTREATETVRVDTVRLRVTARLGGHVAMVARGVLWSYCCRRGDKVMGFGRVDARTLRTRPPLLVRDASGRPALTNGLHSGCCTLKASRAQDDKPNIPCRLQGWKEPATSDPSGPKHSPADASLAVHAASWIDAAMRIHGASASYRDPSPPSWWLLNPQRCSRFDPMPGNCS
jgi:hypothetical protein